MRLDVGSLIGEARATLTAELVDLAPLTNRLARERTPGCPQLGDVAAIGTAPHHRRDGMENVWNRVQLACYNLLANVHDHLTAVSAGLHGEKLPLYTHWTLTRVAVEAATRIRYLLDDRAPFELRLLRGAAVLLHSATEELHLVDELLTAGEPVEPGRQRVSRERDALVRSMRRAGLHFKPSPEAPSITGVSWGADGQVISCKLNIAPLVKEYFVEVPAVYRLSSGRTHSIPWALDDNASFQPDVQSMAWRPDPLDVSAAVTVGLRTTEAVIATYAWYYGHDPKEATKASRGRRAALDRAISRYAATTMGMVLRQRRSPG